MGGFASMPGMAIGAVGQIGSMLGARHNKKEEAQDKLQAQQRMGQAEARAGADRAAILPTLTRDLNATHSMTPDMTARLIAPAEGAAGATAGTEMAKARQAASLTHNASAGGAGLRDIAMAAGKANAMAGEKAAAQDIAGAMGLRQQGLEGIGKLNATDSSMVNAGAEQAQAAQNALNSSNSSIGQTAGQAGQTGASIFDKKFGSGDNGLEIDWMGARRK
jgi:hypothetical protein